MMADSIADLSVKDSILASFIWSADVGMDTKDVFLLDVSLFKDDESKALALMINRETSGERYYSILNMKIEQTMPSLWLKTKCTNSFYIYCVKESSR